MSVTRFEAQTWLENTLASVTPSHKAEARQILMSVLHTTMLELTIDKNAVLSIEEWARIQQIADRRSFHEPLQYILGQQGFMGYMFSVSPSVLIPRPETETLVEWTHAYIEENFENPVRILDIGTGSGAIAISLALMCQSAVVAGTDISAEAVEVAKRNAAKHGVDQRISWHVGDLFEPIEGMSFDVIVSNPPYIPETDRETIQREVRLFEPETALYGGEDGLDFYRRIIPKAQDYLAASGLLVFEAGYNQMAQIETLFLASGYAKVGHFEDLCGIPRFIYGILEGK
jgi:release factor glutamine methyltransferase